MAFDAEGFRSAAKGKFTDAEIEQIIARETQSNPTETSPTASQTAPAEVAPPADFSFEGRKTPLQRVEAFNQKIAEDHPVASTLPYLAAGGAGAAALATLYGGAKAGKAIYNSLSDKMSGGQPSPPSGSPMQRIEPDLATSQKPTGTPEPTFDWNAYTPKTAETTVNTPTVDPVQAMKNKLLASDTQEQFIQRQFGSRYNPNPTEPVLFPVKPDVPPIIPESPSVTPETPSVTPETSSSDQTKPVKPKKADLANIANNPIEIPEQPGMRTQYDVPKTKGSIAINPITGEKYMGPGGYNWFASQVGHENAPKRWEEQYGQKNVPHNQVQEDYAATRYPPTSETISAKGGGSAGKPEFIPKYIKGAASPGALTATAIATALPALGVAAYQKYKGNESAVDASIQEAKDSLKSLATMPYDVSKAALKGDFGPLKDLMLSMNPGSLLFNEMSKKDEEILKKMIYKEKVGAGRGIAPPSR